MQLRDIHAGVFNLVCCLPTVLNGVHAVVYHMQHHLLLLHMDRIS